MSLVIEHATFTYMKSTPFQRTAIEDVSLEVHAGEYVGVIGHTGSGKSTLIQHFNGLLKPDSGRVTIDGLDISAKGQAAKRARRRVGIVFQYPEQQLFEETVEKDIAYGPINYGMDELGVKLRVREAMELVGLDYNKYSQRSPFHLSGGQMRRVAMAGIIALKPDYLILDEPTAGLDPRGRKNILANIARLRRTTGCAVVMVSHNMDEISQYAERVVVMNKGRISLNGLPSEVFSQTKELQAASLRPPEVYRLLTAAGECGLQADINARTRAECADNIYEAWRRYHA